jgi:hypothetical protein
MSFLHYYTSSYSGGYHVRHVRRRDGRKLEIISVWWKSVNRVCTEREGSAVNLSLVIFVYVKGKKFMAVLKVLRLTCLASVFNRLEYGNIDTLTMYLMASLLHTPCTTGIRIGHRQVVTWTVTSPLQNLLPIFVHRSEIQSYLHRDLISASYLFRVVCSVEWLNHRPGRHAWQIQHWFPKRN